MSEPLPRVDCHYHLWDVDRYAYPWLAPDAKRPIHLFPDLSPIAQSYRIDHFLADCAKWNIVKSVHVNGGYDPTDPVGESRYLQSVADVYGHPHGFVAYADLRSPDLDAQLAAHCTFANMRGVRHIVNWHPDPARTFVDEPDLLDDPAWNAGFARLSSYGLSFDLQLYPSQMRRAAALAQRFPDTLIVVNHCGMPLERDRTGLAQWHDGMRALAGCPNVALKISGLGMVDPQWTVDSIRPFVLDALGYFGTDRAMFASNFPVDKLYGSFDVLYEAFDTLTRDLDDDARRNVFGRNAERCYRV
ncbi:amidohydrolase family protein [Pararobbsia silviterrae]|uniref:Amidohydrolase n=1 Tax=Pararobbsia silviterrae TaxID=1792498 RepID=A0A494XTY9_9BURK|nr:amidohydrolase family protein [Pararobbsia silviterrae]RKP53292.1 amidohydrolase [Pararobbsia silviterrae]